MSHGPSAVTINDVPTIVTAEPYLLPPIWRGMSFVLLVFGLIMFCGQLSTEDGAKHAWTAFQVNFIFWFCLAAASTCFSSVLTICNAEWARPIRRLFESGSTFFLWSPAVLLVLFVFKAYNHIFIWAREPVPGKEW